ncbi:MAG: hypothetical protein UX14_C0007G0010 [Parcubacteria group bacterium GW2011_GWF1_45_5]|nr:MAG: hypothetical protein UX14_C0007G0010 [Parcubacteria group bacterium GW2011_GWF1_45_5]
MRSGQVFVATQAVRARKGLKYVVIGVVVLGIGFAVWQWWNSMASADRTELRIEGPSAVRIGERISFKAIITNKQKKQDLRDVSLTFRADSGTEFTDTKTLALYQKYLGALSPMAQQEEEVRAVFWGKQGEERTIEVVARYRIGENINRFEKSQTIKVVISDPAVQLVVSLPQQVITDQEFRSSVEYRKLTTNDWTGARLELGQPEGFSMVRSDPELKTIGKFVWPWEILEPQENSKVVFDGTIASSEGQAKEFTARFFVTVRNTDVLVSEVTEELSIISNPLALTITVSDDPNYAPLPGSIVTYRINFKNNYDIALKDVVIQADATDSWLELDSLKVQNDGFYSSRDKHIVWNGGTTPQLLVLNPRESGTVAFMVKLKDGYPQNATQQVVVARAIMSAQNKPKDVGTSIQTEATLETKIQGKLIVTPKVVFRDDPQTGFINTGTVPLRINQATQYSMYLTVQAVANPFENISFKTILPANITFDGKIKGDESSMKGFLYNPRTGEMSWLIDRLDAYAAKTIVLQLTAIPSSDQIGKLITIIDDMATTAIDAFTRSSVEVPGKKISSDLPDDDTIDANTGRVTP